MKVSEKEFSIALAGGNKLKSGSYTFAVDNVGKIQHDLAIEGNGIKETKTPLIDAGQSKSLERRPEARQVHLLLHGAGPRAVRDEGRGDGLETALRLSRRQSSRPLPRKRKPQPPRRSA